MSYRQELIQSIKDMPNPSPTLKALLYSLEHCDEDTFIRIQATRYESRARVMSYMSTGTEENWRNFLEVDRGE